MIDRAPKLIELIGDARAEVTEIADPISIRVSLIWVRYRGAVIVGDTDVILILIGAGARIPPTSGVADLWTGLPCLENARVEPKREGDVIGLIGEEVLIVVTRRAISVCDGVA